MSEDNELLENEAPAPEIEEQEQAGEAEAPPSESAPDPTPYAVKAINRKHAQYMTDKERADKLEQELKSVRVTNSAAPVIPPLPDPYDNDFDEQMIAREKALVEAERYRLTQEQQQREQQAAAQAQAEQEQKQVATAIATYNGRAAEMQITAEELQAAGQVVHAYGIDPSLVGYILEDEAGPALTTHFARNPEELEKLNQMTPLRAAAYIEQHVKPKARPVNSNRAPAPADTLSGGGAPAKDEGPEGATYE